MTTTVEQHYGSVKNAPGSIFAIWAQHELHIGRLESTNEIFQQYLEQFAFSRRRTLPMDLETYETLVELWVFHCLHPLGQFAGAFDFLQQEQRMNPEKKQVFLELLEDLEAQTNGEPGSEEPGEAQQATQPDGGDGHRQSALTAFGLTPGAPELESSRPNIRDESLATTSALPKSFREFVAWLLARARTWFAFLVKKYGQTRLTAGIIFLYGFFLLLLECLFTKEFA